MQYNDTTKRNCLRLRYKFGNNHRDKPFLLRCKLWENYVNGSNLSDFEKKVCIKEFLNPSDLIRYEGRTRITNREVELK